MDIGAQWYHPIRKWDDVDMLNLFVEGLHHLFDVVGYSRMITIFSKGIKVSWVEVALK